MKKVYEAPVVNLERFELSQGFATCTSVLDSSVTYYPEQTVNCIISGTDYVFSSNCDSDASSRGTIWTYSGNGNTYFIWYDSSIVAKPSSDAVALLNAICAEAGVTPSSSGGDGSYSGYHAGTFTSSIINYYTQS